MFKPLLGVNQVAADAASMARLREELLGAGRGPGLSDDLLAFVMSELGDQTELLQFQDDDGGVGGTGSKTSSVAAVSKSNAPVSEHHCFRLISKSPGSMKRAHTDVDFDIPVSHAGVVRHEVL